MSVLAPSTVRLLREVRAGGPLFPNVMVAELFEAAHTRGPLKLLPWLGKGGGYVVFDAEATLGQGVLAGPMPLKQAHAELERRAP